MHKSMSIHPSRSMKGQHVKFTADVLDPEVLRLATAHYRLVAINQLMDIVEKTDKPL